MYAYANGDPINFTDPRGRATCLSTYTVVGGQIVWDACTFEDPKGAGGNSPIRTDVTEYSMNDSGYSDNNLNYQVQNICSMGSEDLICWWYFDDNGFSKARRPADPADPLNKVEAEGRARGLMASALGKALQALQLVDDCKALFSGNGRVDPVGMLLGLAATAEYEYGDTKNYSAVTYSRGPRLKINTFNGSDGIDWNDHYLNGLENAVTLLHELGHALNSKGVSTQIRQDDTTVWGRSKPEVSWENDSKIWNNCFQMSNPFPKPELPK